MEGAANTKVQETQCGVSKRIVAHKKDRFHIGAVQYHLISEATPLLPALSTGPDEGRPAPGASARAAAKCLSEHVVSGAFAAPVRQE